MISDVGIYIIVTLLVIRIICMIFLKFYQSSWVQKLISFGTYDKNYPVYFIWAYRKQRASCQQYLQTLSPLSMDNRRLSAVDLYFNECFQKNPPILESSSHSQILNLKNWQKLNLNQVIEVNKRLGDFFDVVFYFTDHFSTFFLFDLVRSKQLEVKLQFIGHVDWILNGWYYICAALVSIYLLQKDSERGEQKQKIYKRNILEVISNWNQFILGFSFIYPRWLAREMISLLVIISSVSKLIKLKFH